MEGEKRKSPLYRLNSRNSCWVHSLMVVMTLRRPVKVIDGEVWKVECLQKAFITGCPPGPATLATGNAGRWRSLAGKCWEMEVFGREMLGDGGLWQGNAGRWRSLAGKCWEVEVFGREMLWDGGLWQGNAGRWRSLAGKCWEMEVFGREMLGGGGLWQENAGRWSCRPWLQSEPHWGWQTGAQNIYTVLCKNLRLPFHLLF